MTDRRALQVVMCLPNAQVPPGILHTVHLHLEEMALALAQVDPRSPFWASLRESGLSLEVMGWKFTFSVDPDRLVLTEVEPVPAQV